MENMLLFDTAEGSSNIGDNIIMDYCERQLGNMLQYHLPYYVNKVPTHLEIGKTAYAFNKQAKYSFVCGTNILKATILFQKNWKLNFYDILNLRNLCLMGAGWGNYNTYSPDPYTKWAYRTILSKKLLHSVRDSYTERQLKLIGISNVINTACPTMWRLTPDFCSRIPTTKSKSAVTALTYYKKDVDRDIFMLETIHKNYDEIYFWPQQVSDIDYLQSLNLKFPINMLPPILSVYDKLLVEKDVDFIGSRLHGGIRALNNKCRTLIIGVDNRATEIHHDTNLLVLQRENIDELEGWINGDFKTEIRLPSENIEIWKQQFNNSVGSYINNV